MNESPNGNYILFHLCSTKPKPRCFGIWWRETLIRYHDDRGFQCKERILSAFGASSNGAWFLPFSRSLLTNYQYALLTSKDILCILLIFSKRLFTRIHYCSLSPALQAYATFVNRRTNHRVWLARPSCNHCLYIVAIHIHRSTCEEMEMKRGPILSRTAVQEMLSRLE